MQRITFLAGAALVAVILGVLFVRLIQDPMADRRTALATELEMINTNFDAGYGQSGTPPEQLVQAVIGKNEVWSALIEPPKAAPKPFDINGALQGVSASRHGIGEKAKIITPNNGKGEFYGVGDSINGVGIVEVTKEYVLFKKVHAGKDYTKKIMR